MSLKANAKPKRTSGFFGLWGAPTDFGLAYRAMQCSQATLQYHRHIAGAFLDFHLCQERTGGTRRAPSANTWLPCAKWQDGLRN
jgi:hypothetical protein